MAFKHQDHYHETVAEARSCASQTVSARATARHEGEPLATEPQLAYIKSLLEQRDVPAVVRERFPNLDAITKSEASPIIDKLKEFPVKAGQQKGLPKVEAGYYAVVNDTVEGDPLDFYRVSYEDKPGSRYHGWVRVQVQASSELHLIKRFEEKRRILTAIAADPAKAREAYSSELGRCYVCGRTLTDETSRRLGIGPDCRGDTAKARRKKATKAEAA